MPKVMLFIDGTWLYSNQPRLAEAYGRGQDYRVDYGKLPKVLANKVANQLGVPEATVDIVRTYLFGSYPLNYDPIDAETAEKRTDFYEMLKEDYHYEVEIFAVNYQGRRLRKMDRPKNDVFIPKEKCVDIALATSMLYFAAIPYAYDIAVTVIGDRDYVPVLQHVRRLGKRVCIVSIKGSCSGELQDPGDEKRVKDFDVIWLQDILNEVELRAESRQLECQSPLHTGNKKVWTDLRIRKGRPFYCTECQRTHHQQLKEQVKANVSAVQPTAIDEESLSGNLMATTKRGIVIKIVSEKGFGFIRCADKKEYFFHMQDLRGLIFQNLTEGQEVQFEMRTEPNSGKAGAAQNVKSAEVN